jgi:general secretion pathway protein E
MISYAFAKAHGVVVSSLTTASAEVAVRPDTRSAALAELRRNLGVPLVTRRVEAKEFDDLIAVAYNGSGQGAAALADNLSQDIDLSRLLQEIPKVADLLDSRDDAPVIRLINALLTQALRDGASDIHFEAFESRSVVRLRIDGTLRDLIEPARALHGAIVSRLKIMAQLDIAEKRLPQDGRIALRVAGKPVDVRVSTIPTGHGERVVLRLLDQQAGRLDLAQLGMDEATLAHMDRLIKEPHGIVLVTGPTGSGKTTTLYSTLKTLATPEVNVCTIEDPIEMVEGSFNQMQVQHQIELGFAEGVRALMRQDPDIIMVGEIRDLETAEMAVQSALTGHLVLSTLHTNDAPSAVTRLLELGVAPYLLNATLNGIMAQRLVRVLCTHCKQKVEFNRAEDHAAWDALVAPWKSNRPTHVYKAVGCLECRMTGFSGRVGIYEVLVFSSEVKTLVAGGADLEKLRDIGFKEGMKPLRISGAMKVGSGQTTIEEVLKVAPPIRDVLAK